MNSFSILLEALINDGYSEKDACDLIVKFVEEHLYEFFKDKKVIYCNMKQTPYYEKSPVMPDVLLSDLVAIFHPELMPADYEPTFYRMLK